MSNKIQQKYKYLEFEKLVRDKNPDTIKASGGEFIGNILSTDDFIHHLKLKLVEEANEVLNAKNNEELMDEIGDVIEVLKALIKQSKVKKRYIRKLRRRKAKFRGKFKKGVYCKYVKFPVEVDEKWMHKYKDITDKMEKSFKKEKKY